MSGATSGGWLDSFRPQLGRGAAEHDEPEATCALCAAGVRSGHRHLLQLEQKSIVCVCESCFERGARDAELRRTHGRVEWLEDFRLPEHVWTALGPPAGLALFRRSSSAGRVVALNPRASGAAEAELPATEWARLASDNPALDSLEPDAEALIVDRLGGTPRHLIAPIDACNRLVGLVQSRTRAGMGEPELGPALDDFFYGLRRRGTCR